MPAGIGDYYQILTNGFGVDANGVLSGGYNVLCEGWWKFTILPSDLSVIRNLLMFDDNLVMIASPIINSGLFGYRAGQKLQEKADFIEYIENDPAEVPSDAPVDTPYSPPWVVEDDWTYIEDTFDDGYDSFWDTDFTSNWTRMEYPPGSGSYAAVEGASTTRVLKDSLSIAGDFQFEIEIRLGADQLGANKSIHIELHSAAGVMHTVYYVNADLRWVSVDNSGLNYAQLNNVAVSDSAYQSIYVMFKRVSGVLTAYHKTEWASSWVAFATTNSFDPTITEIHVDGATNNGIGMFRLQSDDSSFPNTPS